jgi:3-phosphoinositide dependent protein kinase-1
MNVDIARFFLIELINALEHIHSRNVTHRDVKPENCMMTASKHLKLTDFGTAKFLLKPNSSSISSHIDLDVTNQQAKLSFVGTAEYLAPEQLNDNIECNETASGDIWAVGCVLYFLLCAKVTSCFWVTHYILASIHSSKRVFDISTY